MLDNSGLTATEAGRAADGMCRAAVFHSPGRPVALEDLPLPELGAGEALVRVECCTLCGSDLHTIRGKRTVRTPLILGHEIVGRITELPVDARLRDVGGSPLEIGDRVVWSVAASCGACEYCLRAMPQKCRSLFKYGHEPVDTGHPLSGGLAQFCQLARGTAVVRLDEGLTDQEVCPASCATATVAEALRSSSDVRGRTVLVLGAGMLGITAAAMCRWRGAEAVIVCDLDRRRLERSMDFGATNTLNWTARRGDFQAKLRDVSGSDKVDFVFEMSGSAEAVEVAPELLRIGGELILVGSVSPSRPVPIDPELIVRRLLRIVGVHNYNPASLHEAVRFLIETRLQYPFGSLVERTFGLSEINDAVSAASESGACRIAVRPWHTTR